MRILRKIVYGWSVFIGAVALVLTNKSQPNAKSDLTRPRYHKCYLCGKLAILKFWDHYCNEWACIDCGKHILVAQVELDRANMMSKAPKVETEIEEEE